MSSRHWCASVNSVLQVQHFSKQCEVDSEDFRTWEATHSGTLISPVSHCTCIRKTCFFYSALHNHHKFQQVMKIDRSMLLHVQPLTMFNNDNGRSKVETIMRKGSLLLLNKYMVEKIQ